MLSNKLPYEKTEYILDKNATDPEFLRAFTTYVDRVLKNTVRQIIRERASEPVTVSIHDIDVEIDEADVDELIDTREAGLLLFDNKPLADVLLSLTHKQKIIADMYYFQEMKVREIAFELGTTEQIVYGLLRRIAERLNLRKDEIRKWADGNCT